uniref:Uncharacterized protein n=1 Tax=Candidatus Kentrum eta TaxID=2126337 RepID=A0A450UW82_9GAMM|nr:MAG: hypothetical protein BECKH772A_GA0070896_101106 [Candidatus Kentron sp. H]VFJ97410.1 MAG: hypothetical protein BECKH772B_GA0070898_101116 [Candidatus Kentron sp. H]VFK02804.1 MAG: hypothetical protein BECKH772C_GA0070978_101036 [Candidatus Kentron sp. H]
MRLKFQLTIESQRETVAIATGKASSVGCDLKWDFHSEFPIGIDLCALSMAIATALDNRCSAPVEKTHFRSHPVAGKRWQPRQGKGTIVTGYCLSVYFRHQHNHFTVETGLNRFRELNHYQMNPVGCGR